MQSAGEILEGRGVRLDIQGAEVSLFVPQSWARLTLSWRIPNGGAALSPQHPEGQGQVLGCIPASLPCVWIEWITGCLSVSVQ